jgi:DNA polymerase-3 subunit delta'
VTNETTTAPLPWHDSAVRNLNSAWQQRRWPHALLIQGPEGLGKQRLARWIAQSILCDRGGDKLSACGECASCMLFAAATHPDLQMISPEEDKQQISVDQIREACANLTMTSYRQGYKVTIVDPAHQMTLAAANSLLKTLEEPTQRTVLILVTSRPAALLATIRSRCQQLSLSAPAERDALEWLATATGSPVDVEILRFANGAPLRALALAEGRYSTLWGEMTAALEALLSQRADVTQIAKQWAKDDMPDRLLCLDHWLMQRIRSSLGQTDEFVTSMVLPREAPALNISRVFVCLDRVRELKAALSRTALQRELALESVLLTILETFAIRIRQ